MGVEVIKRNGYDITCNDKVIMSGTPNIVAHVYSKMTGGTPTDAGDYRNYMATVGTSLKGSTLIEGDRFELRVFGSVVSKHVYGQEPAEQATEMQLYQEWLRQVGMQAGTEAFEPNEQLLNDFRNGQTPADGLLADRLRDGVLAG